MIDELRSSSHAGENAMLAVDVGAGTQDILLYREDVEHEGLYKMIMPSGSAIVAERIGRATALGRDVFLHGYTMGGGLSTAAIKRHLSSGYRVYATDDAALSIHDNLERVRELGVIITDKPESDCISISTKDIDLQAIRDAFGSFGVTIPDCIAVAVQDHGFSPERSNRVRRFELLAQALKRGGRIEDFAYKEPPAHFNRMVAVWRYLKENHIDPVVMDTGPAAVFGALEDSRCRMPALVINTGNGHTLGAVVDEDRITALFEHHTSALSVERLQSIVKRLCAGNLTNQEIFEDGGHGAHIEYIPDRIRAVLLTGPRRARFLRFMGEDVIEAAPWGDMMITGCIGLVKAWKSLGGGL